MCGLLAYRLRRAPAPFVASSTPPHETPPSGGVAISHRGGLPGFIHIAEDGALEIPDYRGNRYFNTLGNLIAYPRAAFAVPDFTTGDLLQLTGSTAIIWDGPLVASIPRAERLWRFQPFRVVRLRDALPLQLGPPEFSPLLLPDSDAGR